MKDIEFVKLRLWLDAEITIIHIYLAVILGFIVHSPLLWTIIIVYIIISLIYAGVRLAYVETKHKGFLGVPKK